MTMPSPASSNHREMKRLSGGIWARLIQKIYEVDPLVCPKCKGAMRVIGSIEDPSVIRAILEHLGLWLARARPPPKIHDPPVCIQHRQVGCPIHLG